LSQAPWIHVDALPEPGATIPLDAGETRHAAKARRLGTGDAVVLTDGRGTTARAELVAGGRRDARARVLERTEHAAESPEIHLASALPKGDRLATLLAMTTQLGITSFTPLRCRHSVVAPGEAPPERWTRILRESAKQSRRAWVPDIRAAETPESVVAAFGEGRAWVMDPDAPVRLGSAPLATPRHLVIVGPEGGLAPAELRTLVDAGATPASLGTGILRVETACVAAVAVLRGRSDAG